MCPLLIRSTLCNTCKAFPTDMLLCENPTSEKSVTKGYSRQILRFISAITLVCVCVCVCVCVQLCCSPGKWQPTPVSLPGKFHGQRSLAGCSPWGCRVGHDRATSLFHFQQTHKGHLNDPACLAWDSLKWTVVRQGWPLCPGHGVHH